MEWIAALQCMSERLDATAAELEQFIERLEECAWRRNGRSKSEYSFRPFPQSTNTKTRLLLQLGGTASHFFCLFIETMMKGLFLKSLLDPSSIPDGKKN